MLKTFQPFVSNGWRACILFGLRNGKLSILFNNGMDVAFDVSWLVCNLWGCVKIYQGTFTYGSLAALIQLMGRIQSPISGTVRLVSEMYAVVASAERLLEVVGLPGEKVGEKIDSFEEIRLEDVSFQYEESREDVLSGLGAVIRRGISWRSRGSPAGKDVFVPAAAGNL